MSDREIIRDLGRQTHALAISPEYEARRKRWRDVNALRRPDRPPVWCKPVDCWQELLPQSELRCAEPALRAIECTLRRQLIKHGIGDDSLIAPWWPVGAVIRPRDEHVWGVPIRHRAPAGTGGAWAYDPPLQSPGDLAKLRPPVFVHDRAATERAAQRAAELFDGVMPVKVVAAPPLDANVGHYAAELLGLDNMMLQLALDPEGMHRLMAFLRDGVLAGMQAVEDLGVLTANNTDEMYCSESFQPSPPDAPVRLAGLWGVTNSQEFDQVSPAMWEEFLLAYQKPVLARFGRSAYGCCENLTHKIAGVLSIPNLRIFVCSAWSDLGKVADAVGGRHAIMWRQKASDVVFAPDPAPIRRHLREGVARLRGCRFQIVLRELQTLGGRPRRLHEWTALAKEAAEDAA